MNIKPLIDQNFTSVSVLEDTRVIAKLLKEIPYIAVVD